MGSVRRRNNYCFGVPFFEKVSISLKYTAPARSAMAFASRLGSTIAASWQRGLSNDMLNVSASDKSRSHYCNSHRLSNHNVLTPLPTPPLKFAQP